MQKKTQLKISLLFFIITVLFSINVYPVFAVDDVGNKIVFEQGSHGSFYWDETTNATYVEGYNVTYNTYSSKLFNFYFKIDMNATNATNAGAIYANQYVGLGLQIFDDEGGSYYANGFEPDMYLIYPTSGIIEVIFETYYITINPIYREMYSLNATLWVNYEVDGQAENYTMVDEWKFNLVAENYGDTDEPEYVPLEFNDVFFAGALLGGFTFPLFFVGAIKLRRLEFIGYSVIAFMVFISCFCVLIDFNPIELIYP